jgi:2-polyprenyl-3-methyl-5-hydroxy-6-metoxy-1,4-benzoquinol methylase
MLETRDSSGFDSQKAEAFAGRLLSALNNGAFCLMASIGHRTGLFDVMLDQPPMASDELAVRAGLNERYVREWLGAMVTAGVVDVDRPTLGFSLPPEHAAFLTRAAAANNIAVFAQYIALLGDVEDDIVECFKHGGGVSYQRFPRFHAVMAEDSGQSVLSSLESHILPLVPGLSDQLARGIRTLDVGCGQGRIIIRLAELFPNSQFVGMDLSEDAIAAAGNQASAKGLRNIEFVAIDLSNFHETAEHESFDFITTFDAVHDQAAPLNGIHRALRRDGLYLMQDIKGSSHVYNNIAHPIGTFL